VSISNGSSSSSRSGSNRSPFTQTWYYKRLHIIIAEIGAPPVSDTGSFIRDLSALACQLASQLRSARWPAVLPSIIDAAEPFAESVV
jgi:hypothetical protein